MNLNKYKILDLFERENRPLFFREISKKSGVSIGGVQKVLSDNRFFFDKDVRGRNTYYSIKKGIIKRFVSRLIESERALSFFERNSLLNDFFEKIFEEKIICLVFGSYASFNNKKNSDLDLLVLGNKALPEHLSPVDLHVIRVKKKDFKRSVKSENLMKEIKRNHVIIFGLDYFLEVFENGKN